jgi:hypothetical protein
LYTYAGGAMTRTTWNMLISWAPFILLIGFWVYFMRRMRTSRQGELIERTFNHYDRVEALLERIALNLEGRGTPPPTVSPPSEEQGKR